MKFWILLITVLLFSSCGKNNINALTHTKVDFKSLPAEIKEYLRNPTEAQKDIQTMLLELPKGSKPNYRLETVKTWIGPWVAYEELIDINKNVSYKIDQGLPSPYIVFDDKLYVSDKHNIFTTVDDLDSVEFTCYELK